MNDNIVRLIKESILKRGIKYKFLSETTGIEYQRLMRIFHQGAILSGLELLKICKVLEINQERLMEFVNDDVA